MKKRTYRSKKINQIHWESLGEKHNGEQMLLAVDVAKHDQFALLNTQDGSISELLKWSQPALTEMPYVIFAENGDLTSIRPVPNESMMPEKFMMVCPVCMTRKRPPS